MHFRMLQSAGAALLKERVVDISQSGALHAAGFSWNMIQRLLLFLRANTGEFIKELQSVSASLVANYTPKDLPLNVRSLVFPEESGSMSVRGMLQEGREGTELQEHLDNFVKHAKVIEEIGYSCTASPDSFATVLDMLPPPDEASVAEMISMMARTYSGLDGGGATLLALNTALGGTRTPEPSHRTTWSVDIAIDVLLPRIQHVSLPAAVMHLDHPEFFIPDQTSFTLLMQMFNRATSERFPINAICGRPWANTEGQLSFLSHAVNASAEVFSFEHSPNKQAPLDGLSSNKQATGTANQCWLSLDLISTLFDLAELGHYAKVRSTFEQPRKHCPEVLFLGIAQASSRWTELQSELFNAMVPSFMSNHPNSTIVMHRLWQTRRELALQGMVEVYARDRSSITRVLDICQDIKELGTVLQSTPYTFALDLAALAARREYLNIEKWLGEQISTRGRPFVSACCEFLKGLAEEARAERKPAVSVSEETYALFVKVLQQRASEDLPQPEADDAKQTCDELLDSNQRLQRLLAESQTFGPQTFSRDVEDDANSHFQQLYMGKCDAEELSKTLSRYRSSGGPHEKQVLACIIRNLLDEYRFFPRYPERELRLTASLFGEIIHYGLLEPLTLGLALRLILDSLRKDPSNHMYIFGSEALEGFKTRALEWRQFCEQLLHSPHLRTTHPEFVRTIERAHLANGHAPQNSAVTDGAVQSSQSHADAAAEAANAMFSHQSSSLLQADASTRGDAGGRSIEAKMASMSLHGNVNGEQMTTSSSTEAGAPSFGRDDQRQQQQRSQSNIYVPNTNCALMSSMLLQVTCECERITKQELSCMCSCDRKHREIRWIHDTRNHGQLSRKPAHCEA
jgi:CCR4-NOT transcription complex subunit 1